jgi:lipoyl(octanoyl) transferase
VGTPAVTLRTLGMTDYGATLEAMRAFNRARDSNTTDEIWLTEHPSVYTLGLAGRREHLLDTGDIAVVASDRGGQVTYHGPGQLVIYLLLNLGRRQLKVREVVRLIEGSILATLLDIGIEGHRLDGMPGVYVAGEKIAALGLKVSRGCTYHGLSLNVDMDLEPFARIDPCGYRGLRVTQVVALRPDVTMAMIAPLLARHLRSWMEPDAVPVV